MPIRNFTASSYVAAQTKNIRKQRRWSQEDLAGRLSELVAGPSPEIFKDDDPRRRQAQIRKTLPRKWTQSRVAKLERGALKCVSVDDVLELALALDVSPLALITPMLEPQDPEDRGRSWSLLRPKPDDVFRVAIGNFAYWPREVRQWIRGVKPLLGIAAYRSDDAAARGRRFYLLDSQPVSEWTLIEEGADYASRVRQSVTLLAPGEPDDAS